jgi:hypothetical protein
MNLPRTNAGRAYVQAHRTPTRRPGRIARREIRNLAAAIGRLIDNGELAWNPATDELELTPEGERAAAAIAWWWDRRSPSIPPRRDSDERLSV